MKKILKRNKGFTLVECLVAIAIFALMSTLVMQILALSIKQYRKNHHTTTDIDQQIVNIVKENEKLVPGGTADVAINFVKNGGSTVVSGIEIKDVAIKKNPDSDEPVDRFEINTFDATIMPDETDKDDDKNGSMITEDIHLYGTQGIRKITVSEDTDKTDENSYKISLNFKVYDPDKILKALPSNAIKVVVPDSAKFVKLTNNDDNRSSYLKLSSTNYRIFHDTTKTDGDANESYEFTISFEMDKNSYDAEYISFAKYFISPNSTEETNSSTFNDAVTPGIYTNNKNVL